jgi:hypothetical protein
MRRFADHARKMASTRECSMDDMVLGQAWHIMPRLPQFTVCEECYDEVVWPLIDAGSLSQQSSTGVCRLLDLVV